MPILRLMQVNGQFYCTRPTCQWVAINKSQENEFGNSTTMVIFKRSYKNKQITWIHSPCWSLLDLCKINLEKSSSTNWIYSLFWNLIFTACVVCKNQFRNWYLEAKNPVCWAWSLQLDFLKINYRSTGGLGSTAFSENLSIDPILWISSKNNYFICFSDSPI